MPLVTQSAPAFSDGHGSPFFCLLDCGTVSEARLILTCGLPGAGKTRLATKLAADRSAVRLTKDEWLWALGSPLGMSRFSRRSNMNSGASPKKS